MTGIRFLHRRSLGRAGVFAALLTALWTPIGWTASDEAVRRGIDQLAKQERRIQGDWALEKGTGVVEALDRRQVGAARSALREMAAERGGRESLRMKECHLLADLLGSRVMPDRRDEVLSLAKTVLAEQDKEEDAEPSETYLRGHLYHAFLHDQPQAVRTYKKVLRDFLDGEVSFRSSSSLKRSFESFRKEAPKPVLNSYSRLLRVMEAKETRIALAESRRTEPLPPSEPRPETDRTKQAEEMVRIAEEVTAASE